MFIANSGHTKGKHEKRKIFKSENTVQCLGEIFDLKMLLEVHNIHGR